MDNRRQSGVWQQQHGTDFYERQPPAGPYAYYQPPTRKSTNDGRRSFSERKGSMPGYGEPFSSSNGTRRSDSQKVRDMTRAASERVTNPQGPDSNYVPNNVRSKPWSPDPAMEKPRQESNASEPVRRGSVPDRSPLQRLEMTAKEEKRARVQQAELQSRHNSVSQAGAMGGNNKGRAVSDGSRMPKNNGYYRENPRQMPANQFEQASEALQYRPTPPMNHKTFVSKQRQRQEKSPGSGSAGPQSVVSSETQKYHGHHATDATPTTSSRKPAQPHRTPTGDVQSVLSPETQKYHEHHATDAMPTTASRPTAQTHRTPTGDVQSILSPETQKYHEHHATDAMPTTASRPTAQPHRTPTGDVQSILSPETQKYHGHHATDATPTISTNQTGQPYHNAPGQPREIQTQWPGNPVQRQHTNSEPQSPGTLKSGTRYYQHRARDAGYAGAGAAVAGATGLGMYEASSGGRDRASSDGTRDTEGSSSQMSPTGGTPQRRESKKLQKRQRGDSDPKRGKQQLQSDRMGGMGSKKDRKAAEESLEPDPLPKERVATGPNDPVGYKVPPQTAAGQQAHSYVNDTSPQVQQDGFAQDRSIAHADNQDRHHHLGGVFHRDHHQQRGYMPSSEPLSDWRTAQVGKLSVADLEFDQDTSAGANQDPWWEKGGSRRRASTSARSGVPAQVDGPYEEEARQFKPMLYLKCGPLLRYTGMRREDNREIWRGSVMIVTADEQSIYSPTPNLRLFAQPADLHQPPSRELLEGGEEIPPEYEDPIAGQVKLSRTGRPLYVRPARNLDGGVDLSRTENNQGLFAATRTPTLGPQYTAGQLNQQGQQNTFQAGSRIKSKDGEKAGRYKDVKAVRLHAERGRTFWRWNIEIELGSTQHRVAYRVNKGPAMAFWVPARGETMHIMFHSCNGFSASVNPDDFSGPDPLWRSVLNRHQARPFHVMLGGGDQIYNDRAMHDTELFRSWLQIKNPHEKHSTEFSVEMQEELESFYLNRYAMWFSQGLFAMAGSQIPMVNVWDDHDIMDGFGSYPHHFMSTPVFTGLGAIAFKYYMLFQHQTVVAETDKEEPSWVLGASPGPYINELSRSVFLSLGRKVAFLGVDCRTERMRDEILSEQSYDILFERCQDEITKGEVQHLIVLLGVPIAYPRLNFLENILTSRVMDPIKAIGRTGMLGGFVNKFDGGVEILDDLDDHWTAKHHKQERNWFIQELQELAAAKSVRITILGGDVHLGAVGQFYTPKKLGVQKDRDHRYMPNIISSAIVNTPPPPMMADVLNKRNKVHHLDEETDEDLIPMFEEDVDGSKRNNRCLLPRRNYCTIREFQPGSTPPPTPPPEQQQKQQRRVSFDQGDEQDFEAQRDGGRDRRYPPGSMRGRNDRTMSLTRGPGSLMRRFSSGSRRNKNRSASSDGRQQQGLDGTDRPHKSYYPNAPSEPWMSQQQQQRSQSMSGPRPESASTARGGENGYANNDDERASGPQQPRPGFFRRPTLLTSKDIRAAAAKGGAHGPDSDDGNGSFDSHQPGVGEVNLQGGLDICLNMEIDQRDPGGATMPYRMLVPALWYEGRGDENRVEMPKRGVSLMDRLRGRGRGGEKERRGSEGSFEGSEDGGSRTPSPPPAVDKRQISAPMAQEPQRGVSSSGAGGGPGWTPTATGGVRMPSRQQSQQAQPQQKQGYGSDGAYSQQQQTGSYFPPSAMAGGRRQSMDQSQPSAYDRGLQGSKPPLGGYDATAGAQQPIYPSQAQPDASRVYPRHGRPAQPSQLQQPSDPSYYQPSAPRKGQQQQQQTYQPSRRSSAPGPAAAPKPQTQRPTGRPSSNRYPTNYSFSDNGSMTPSEGSYDDRYDGGRYDGEEGRRPRPMSKAEKFFGMRDEGEQDMRRGGAGGGSRKKWQIWK